METDHGLNAAGRRARRARGLTLVELLVALSVLATVGLLLAGAVRGLRGALAGFLARESRLGGPAAFFRALARETESAIEPPGIDGAAFSLLPGPPGGPGLWTLEYYSALPEPGSDDPARADPSRIRYEAFRENGGVALRRTEEPLRDDPPGAPPAPVIVLRGCRAVELAAGGGNGWSDRWPEENSPALPARIRVRVETRDDSDPVFEAEFPIPAATAVSPSRIRAAAP